MFHHLCGLRTEHNVFNTDNRKIQLDSFIVYSDEDLKGLKTAEKVANNKLLDTTFEEAKNIVGVAKIFNINLTALKMRARFNHIEFVLFHFEEEIERDEMETIINSLPAQRLQDASVTI